MKMNYTQNEKYLKLTSAHLLLKTFSLLCFSGIANAQTYVPIAVSGFNYDLIANGVGTVVATTTKGFDSDNSTGANYYVTGYSTGTHGLPANGIINSVSTAGVNYQLANYSGNNALVLVSLNQQGTLTFLSPGVFDKLSICAASAGTPAIPTSFNAVVNFSDNTSTSYSFSVPDWFSVGMHAITGVDRVYRDGTFNNISDNPKMFDCIITLNASDKLKIVNSITFKKTVSNDKTGIFAVCGITSVGTPAAVVANPFSNATRTSFIANWNNEVLATSYKIDVSTLNDFSILVSPYNNYNVGNVTSFNVTTLSAGTTFYYRVRATNASGQGLSSNIITAYTTPNAPAATVSSNKTATTFQANWNTSAGATSYLIDVATDLAFASLVAGYNKTDIGNVNFTSITGIDETIPYYYRVYAKNQGGIGSVSNSITVKGSPAIVFNNPANIVYGTQLTSSQLNATTTVAGNWVYNPAAGTILSAGANQNLSVTFTPTDLVNYNIVNKTAQITIDKAMPVITWNNPSDTSYGAKLDSTQLNASAAISGSWVYNPTSGTALNVGANQVLQATFTPADNLNYNNASKTVFINVVKANPVISWAKPADIVYGTAIGSEQLNASAIIAGTWAYTPLSGTVISAGSDQLLSITFTPTDAVNYNEVIKTQAINVIKQNPDIQWNNPSDIVYGTALGVTQLNALTTIPGTWAYTPAMDSILYAGANQILTATFTPTDAANYNTAIKTALINVKKFNPVIQWNNPADIVYGDTLNATQLNATTSVAGNFTYYPKIGSLLPAGVNKTITTTFTPTDTANYNTVSDSVKINIAKATPKTLWNKPSDIIYGTALSDTQLNATSVIAGSWTYSPVNGSILSAGSNQLLNATFIPSDSASYTSTTISVLLNVVKQNPSILWGNPNDIVYKTELSEIQLNATAKILGEWIYTPASGSILLAGLNRILSTTFLPADSVNYSKVTKTVQINVLKSNPIISWNNPQDIVYGTLLNTNQLNAQADIAGTWEYNPAIGSLLNAGANQLLTTTFTPTDTANYNVFSKTASLNITRQTPVVEWVKPSDIIYGYELTKNQLNASTTIEGTWIFTPALNTKLNAGQNQLLTATFTPNSENNYAVAYKTTLITVQKANPVIIWEIPPFTISDSPLSNKQLNATANIEGVFIYTPASGTILNYGLAQILETEFIPVDSLNYSHAKQTAHIDVMKAAPTVQAQITSVKDNSGIKFTVNWLRGNGDYCKVFVCKTTSGTPLPIFNTDYSDNLLFESGEQIDASGWYCVYNGTGTSVTVTGLSISTNYRLMVVEYNEFNNVKNYLLSTNEGNPLNIKTMDVVELNIIASNYISPNGDGKNDTWQVERIDELIDFDLFIYNNIGEELYHTKAYNNSWQATFKGKDLPSGTYYYVFKKESRVVKGFITVVR